MKRSDYDVYAGFREEDGVDVRVNDRDLDLEGSLVLRNHSPTGFEWGYGGSGPAQLALAILFDFSGDIDMSLEHYQRFKWEVVARLPKNEWRLSGAEVRAWLEAASENKIADPPASANQAGPLG